MTAESTLVREVAKLLKTIEWPHSDSWCSYEAIARVIIAIVVERCAAEADRVGDEKFAAHAKKTNLGIATLTQRHCMDVAAAIRALKT